MGWSFILDNAAIWRKLSWILGLGWFFLVQKTEDVSMLWLLSFVQLYYTKSYSCEDPLHPHTLSLLWSPQTRHLKSIGGFVEADGAPGYEKDGWWEDSLLCLSVCSECLLLYSLLCVREFTQSCCRLFQAEKEWRGWREGVQEISMEYLFLEAIQILGSILKFGSKNVVSQ